MGRRRAWLAVALLGLAGLAALAGACGGSDNADRLAAQRLFRNFLVQPEQTAAADVRIHGLVDALPPDFPVADGLDLLGSAFTDSDTARELIVGWQATGRHADDLYDFYSDALDREPWSLVSDPRIAGIDFLSFRDQDNPVFRGELRIAQEGGTAVVVLIAREAPAEGGGGGA